LTHPLITVSSVQVIALHFTNKEVVMFSKTALMVGTIMSVAVAGPVYAGSTASTDQADTMATDDALKSDVNKMGDEVANEYENAKDFTYEEKDEFLAWVEEKSDQLGDQYDEVSASVKQDSEEAVDELAEAWDGASAELGEAFEDAKEASAESWEEVKQNTMTALEDAQNALSDDQTVE
tara:strand:+ start:155 stop:691 length:537 start_codon:yes stop_codon:yes gene_type:complete